MIFPFSAIVGQDQMKLGLVLNVIDPAVGGLLVMGEKGTGKSTAVRALAELLPEYTTSKGCPFNCDPDDRFLCTACAERQERTGRLEREPRKMRVVELPLGTTEDRLIGTMDIEHALQYGEKRFEPGILAGANRNFLYVDEVNLLEDHIVDLLLDSAAMGRNIVEREGVSFAHPSRFMLVGTMNPEEGDLRPQLLDRFGLSVYVRSLRDKEQRIEILRRRAAFDIDSEGFAGSWRGEQENLAGKIVKARESLPQVTIPEDILDKVVTITSSIKVDGHRADIVMLRAAKALAAFRGRQEITLDDVKDICSLALVHRLKRLPFQETGSEMKQLEQVLTEI
jgi:magnesium chelatase subunit I